MIDQKVDCVFARGLLSFGQTFVPVHREPIKVTQTQLICHLHETIDVLLGVDDFNNHRKILRQSKNFRRMNRT